MNVIERFQRSFSFNWGVGTIEFGAGKINELGNIVKGMSASKAMILTDKGVVDAGILEQVTKPLEDANIEYFVFGT